ncbi:MAG TPA: hypothetical protein VFZ21_26320 [Gemmatimonadaceae bacterium]|jgi:hypothetical protein|nr:hypothetical protein [Gemmatimonadaceae bacterium]
MRWGLNVRSRPGFSVGPNVMWLAWLSFTVVVVAGVLFAELAPATLT